MSRDSLITVGVLVVTAALFIINWIGRRHKVQEARFDSKTGKEIK